VILNAIQFPNLDPSALTIPEFDILSLHVGPLHLRWYALAYIVGLVLGWRWMVHLIRKDRLWAPGKPALSVPQADDFLFWATLGVILGGRIGYILFYNTSMIWENPMGVFQIWQGGMSFHGGFIGVALAAYFFTRQKHVNEAEFAALAKKRAVAEPPRDHASEHAKVAHAGWLKKADIEELKQKARTDKIDVLRLGDLAAAATPIGLFFGRIANFINGELWGRQTNLPWGMVFCNERLREAGNGVCLAGEHARHPSQLYEAALEGLLLFAILNVATLKFDSLRRPGFNAGVFLVCYGLFRASLETVREPDAQMPEFLRGYITMGMLLSIPMMLLGAWLIRRALKQPKLA
jgi:phosphatidylglycerol:prolipoprotein diacylglycerol transferase